MPSGPDLKALRRKVRERRREAESGTEAPPGGSVRPGAPADLTAHARPTPPTPPAPGPAARLLADTAARVPALLPHLERLDPWQLRAVASDAATTVVEAQVGSGKTTVLVHKVVVAHLVDAVPLAEMAVLTFTTKAAREFEARVSALLAEAGAAPPTRDDTRWFGTFHALARALLVHDLPLEELGYRRDFQVMDAEERLLLWQHLIARHGLDVRYPRQLERRMAGLAEGRVRFGNMRRDDDLVRLAELAADERRARNVMDFDELLANAQALLATAGLPRRPAWIIIDELQDCDFDQLDLVDALAGPDTRRLMVGDPNQVIYSWRGSTPGLFDHAREAMGAETVRLPVNYRSSATIVGAARGFLTGSGRLEQRATAELVAHRDPGGPLIEVAAHDPRAEADWVAAQVVAALAGGCAPEDIAVLARTRRRLAPLQVALESAGVPVRDDATWRITAGPTVRWLRHLLRAVAAHDDALSAALALGDSEHGCLRAKDLRALVAEDPSADARALLRGFIAGRRKGRRRKGEDLDLAERVLDGLDRAAGAPTWQDAWAQLGLDALLRPTRPGFERRKEAAEATMAEVWQRGDLAAALAEGTTTGPARGPGAGVRLLTLHAAKGLEWRVVFIVGCNDGALPLPASLRDPEQLQEERRLFFVGMTRARDRLALSWVRSPDDPRERGLPSAFLGLIPEADITRHDHPAPVWERAEASPDDDAQAGAHADARADARADAQAEDDGWHVGQPCRHPRYGRGEVVAVEAEALVCRFPGRGDKRFSLALCPVVPDIAASDA